MTSLTLPTLRSQHSWRWPLVSTVVAVLLILLAYQGTAEAIVHIWARAQTYNHGFVVLPIAIWLMWRQRAVLATIDPVPAPWVLLPMAGLAMLWWLGRLVNVAAAMQFALVAMLALVVPLVLGLRVARALAFPLCFMLFAVPIGDFMVPALMHWTAEVLVASLRLTGLPVYQEGQLLIIPTGRWAVVEACGGIRYLLATFMVGCLFAHLNYRSTKRRLVFMAVSLVVPVVANWVRAYLIVMLGHLTNNKYGAGDDHLVYGWGFFGVVIMTLFFIGARWAEPDEEPPVATAAPAAAPAGMLGRAPVFALLALAAATWPVWLYATAGGGAADRAAVRLALPDALGTWRADPAAALAWKPAFLNPAAEQSRLYRQGGAAVAVHVAYYRGQDDDAKLVSSANRLVGPEDKLWHVVGQGVAQAGPAGQPLTWFRADVMATEAAAPVGSTDRPRLTVWRLYWIDGRGFHSDVRAKLWQAWLAVRGQSGEGAAIHLVSALPDADDARAELTKFVAENFGMLEATLAQVRAAR